MLGKKGDTIHGLRAKYGLEIKIDQETAAQGYSIATIFGADETAVNGAAEEIQSIELEYKQFLIDASQNERTLNISQKYVGLIIGNRGVTIQKIKNETG